MAKNIDIAEVDLVTMKRVRLARVVISMIDLALLILIIRNKARSS